MSSADLLNSLIFDYIFQNECLGIASWGIISMSYNVFFKNSIFLFFLVASIRTVLVNAHVSEGFHVVFDFRGTLS